jgi:hypothetical protein
MMGPAFEVSDAILAQFGFEPAGAPPGGVLAAVIGEHLLGGRELAHRDAVDFDDGLGGGTAEQIGTDQEAGVIVQETDQVGVAAPEAKGEDIALPHLIGRGPLKEARSRQIAPRPWPAPQQSFLFEPDPNGFRAGS